MQVKILCREPEVAFSTSSAVASNTVRAVLKQYCKHLSITERDCQFFCDDVPLSIEQKLSQVPGSSAGVIYLDARIQPSIALYHWQLFHVASLRNPSMYPAVWQAATEQYVHAHRYHEQQLPPPQHIAAVKGTTRMLLPLHCPPSSDRAAPALPTDLAPVRPLFQLTQILLSQVPSDTPHARTASKTASSSEPDSPRSLQIKSVVVNPVAPTAANEVAMLQTVLLVLKLISLLTAVSSPSVSVTTAVVVLWQTVINTLSTLSGIQCNRGWPEDSIDSMRSEHPSHSEAWFDTVVALTGLLMTQLRQCLVKEGASEQACLCCNSLSSLLELPSLKRSYRTAVAMAAAIKDPTFGGLAVLVSGLKKCSGARADKHARTIVELLNRVCSRQHLTADSVQQHLKLLAQMQTAFHLSGLFCPVLDKDDESKKTQAQRLFETRFITEAEADEMPSDIDQVDRLMAVAYLMKRLLAVDRESQPDSQGFTQRMALPLPEANALWQGRQKIFLRALFPLECLQDWLTPVDRHAHEPHCSLLMEQGSSPLLIGYLVQTLHECLAGHLLDPRLDVRMIFSHAFNGVMLAWAQSAGDSLVAAHALGTLFLQRLVSQYKVLLNGRYAGLESSDILARDLTVTAFWRVTLERFKEGQMGTVADAMEALHALVCHTTFCHQLLRVCCRPMIPCFKPLLLALRLWPIAQLTFGASLVCLATEAYNCSFQHREGLPLSASTTSEVATAGLVDSIRQNCTLDVVCSCLQDALLVPMPWSTEHAVRVARVLQRMALICRQQPQLVSPIIKEAQASVLQCLLRLLPDIRPEGVQEDLLIGALLFSGLPYQKPFTGDVAASQDVVDSLIGLLTGYSTPPAFASSASSTADASPQSDAQQSTSSEHAHTAQQSYETQKSLHTKITQGGDLLGGDQNPLGLIQHWHTGMQPMILSGLLACLPQDHVFSEAIFADCEKWYIQVAENLFLMGQQQEEPWLAIPFVTPYLHMMLHMEWPSKRKVSARLSKAFIQHVLLLLLILKHRHEDSKAEALASRSLASAEKASNLVKAELFEGPHEGLLQNPHGVIKGSQPLPSSVRSNKYGSLIVMETPMHLRVESIDQIKALLGLLLHCMHHMQEDADWQLAVAADFPGSRQWREQLPAVMKLLQLVPLLPSADMCKLLFWFEPVLKIHANAAAAGAAAAELMEEEEQAAALALAKAAAKKAKKQRQKLKKSSATPEPQHSIDSGQSTASGQQSPEGSALHSVGTPSERGHGKTVDTAPSPAADQTAVSQTSAAFLLNLFRCPLSKVMMSDPVVAADGHTYERAAITSWLQQHTTSPVTKQPLPHKRMFSNQAAKAAIADQHAV